MKKPAEVITANEATKLHPFERAGLGKAPFRYVGWYESKFQAIPGDPSCPIQPGSSCDFCSQGIMVVCRIKSADGREFKVGQDCCRRTGDVKLVDVAKRIDRDRSKKMREAKSAAQRAELDELLADEAVRQVLASKQRLTPVAWLPPDQNTLLGYVEWLAQRAGAAGRLKALKAVKAELETA